MHIKSFWDSIREEITEDIDEKGDIHPGSYNDREIVDEGNKLAVIRVVRIQSFIRFCHHTSQL